MSDVVPPGSVPRPVEAISLPAEDARYVRARDLIAALAVPAPDKLVAMYRLHAHRHGAGGGQ